MISIDRKALQVGVKAVSKRYNEIKKENQKHLFRAVDNTTRKTQTLIVNESAKLTNIPKGKIRGKKKRANRWEHFLFIRPTRRHPKPAGFVNMYAEPRLVRRLLSERRLMKGLERPKKRRAIKARGRSFPQAFIGRMQNSNKAGVFQRRGRGSLPLDTVKIPVEKEINKAIKNVQPESAKIFRDEYDKALKKARF